MEGYLQTAGGAPEQARCALHVDIVATGTCVRCGNYMCETCTEQGTREHCPSCRERLGIGTFPFSRDDWSIEGVLAYSWDVFKREWGNLVVAALLLYGIVFAISFGFSFLQMGMTMGGAAEASMVVSIVSSIVQNVVQGVLQVGLYGICIDALVGRGAQIGGLFAQWRKVLKIVAQTLVVALGMLLVFAPVGVVVYFAAEQWGEEGALIAMAIAFVLLLVPLIYVSLGLFFMQYELANDDEVGPLEAIGRSWRLVQGNRLALIGIALIGFLIVIAGVLLCCIGILAALPLASLLTGSVYLALRNGSGLPEPVRYGR